MKKRIALLLVLALCISSLVGLTAIAEGEATPSLEIAYCTVPMQASVCILYAVAADEYDDASKLKVLVWENDEADAVELSASGVLEIGGKDYVVFAYTGLSAAEMRTVVYAKVSYDGALGTKVASYSVAAFVEAYCATDASQANKDMVSAMLAYGDAVANMEANKA